MKDLRDIGYAGVTLNLGGPHSEPSLSRCVGTYSPEGYDPPATDHAREATSDVLTLLYRFKGCSLPEEREALGTLTRPVHERIQQAIDAATEELVLKLDDANTLAADVILQRNKRDAEIERCRGMLVAEGEQARRQYTRIAALERVVEVVRAKATQYQNGPVGPEECHAAMNFILAALDATENTTTGEPRGQ